MGKHGHSHIDVCCFLHRPGISAAIVRFLRVFRLARLLRLAKSLAPFRALFATLVQSLGSVGSVGTILIMLFYVYAYIGMTLFGRSSDDEANGKKGSVAYVEMVLTCFLSILDTSRRRRRQRHCSLRPRQF